MADENTTLSASESAFFESGGETPIVETPEAPEVETPTVETPEIAEQPIVEQARDEKGKFVPHQALHAEREEHKKTRSELQTIKERQAVLEDRWNTLLKASAAQETPVDEPPDPNVDVFAALKWTQDKLLEQQKSAQETREQQERQTQEQQAEQQVWSYWQQDAASYTKENPDFGNAAKWLSDYRDKQLTAYSAVDSRFASPQARNAQIETELKDIVIRGAQAGRSPASIVYEIAKGYGYATKPAEAETIDPANVELSEKLTTIDKAMAQSKTLGQAAGRAGGDALSAEAIASMPEREFEAWMKTPANAARFKTLMGG
ncbi:MAG: hypothetical protein E5Y67_12390 [Mesorhizobium sp.]|uniref:hypothetical protein n=1 Tax=Mesorhizobium sp. TaxID=1871066 RepID=UPI00121E6248|nr:hypothetical protein [Mesorhizobium sp.]TIM14471.1 MAG: hypothetical protein E5Y67_12390 [Mesorhizobium sp.]